MPKLADRLEKWVYSKVCPRTIPGPDTFYSGTGAQCPADNKLLKHLGYKTFNEAAHLINKTAAK